jgi:hypothetical protein
VYAVTSAEQYEAERGSARARARPGAPPSRSLVILAVAVVHLAVSDALRFDLNWRRNAGERRQDIHLIPARSRQAADAPPVANSCCAVLLIFLHSRVEFPFAELILSRVLVGRGARHDDNNLIALLEQPRRRLFFLNRTDKLVEAGQIHFHGGDKIDPRDLDGSGCLVHNGLQGFDFLQLRPESDRGHDPLPDQDHLRRDTRIRAQQAVK